MLPRKNWRADLVLLFVAPLMGLLVLGLVGRALAWREAVPKPVSAAPPEAMEFRAALLNALVFQSGLLVGMFFFVRAHQVTPREAFGLRLTTNKIGRAHV